MSQPNHPMYAVLIGIDEYENAATLEGPTQDLKLMGDLCDSLKILKKNRKVLAGKGATVAKIQSALDWLEEALDDENATALVHFSGHGTLFNQSGLDDTLALAAYDFAPDAQASASDQGLLTIRALAARFGKPKRKATETVKLTPSKKDEVTTAHLDALAETKLARITFVLDCCWNQEELSSSTCVHLPLMSYRMFLGCSRNDAANEIWMDGQKVGAFTWALTTALSRWTVKQHDGNQQMTVTHAKLMDRVHHLFSALSIKGQTPMLAGPRVLDILPVFQRSMDWDAGAVLSEEPDVVDDHRQLWGGDDVAGLTYELVWGGEQPHNDSGRPDTCCRRGGWNSPGDRNLAVPFGRRHVARERPERRHSDYQRVNKHGWTIHLRMDMEPRDRSGVRYPPVRVEHPSLRLLFRRCDQSSSGDRYKHHYKARWEHQGRALDRPVVVPPHGTRG